MIITILFLLLSTFINSFAGKACTKTGNKPGVTKGKQWIRMNKTLELLDTPGILWPKFEDQQIGLYLALIGSINDEVLQMDELAVALIGLLKEHYPGLLANRYGIEETDDHVKDLHEIAKARKCFLKGEELDIRKAANLVMDDFRAGRLGKITLERP